MPYLCINKSGHPSDTGNNVHQTGPEGQRMFTRVEVEQVRFSAIEGKITVKVNGKCRYFFEYLTFDEMQKSIDEAKACAFDIVCEQNGCYGYYNVFESVSGQNPDKVIRAWKSCGPEMNNLVRLYNESQKEGANWYPEALAYCKELSAKYGIPLANVVGALAARRNVSRRVSRLYFN